MRFKKPNGSALKFQAILLPLGVGLTMPATTAYATIASPDEVIVTARRMKEEAQTVPISLTVFNQEMLSERNVTNGADLATFTPSLSVNTRFGADQTTFAIRGFTQELRTTASVAVYFADVVAPRGGGSVTAGDGAGPGAFFDLQNVQVLKGPQGTLFGRNTTGGAIQLVPQEPTTKFEGYLEVSDGNYDMHRYQGVVNVPISDNVRARFGFDRQTRDGYVNNISGIGPDTLSDIDYTSGRASVMWDISDTLRNYSIYTNTYSHNNGSVQGIFQCDSGGGELGGVLCDSSYSVWQDGGGDFYDVVMDTPDPTSMLRQWQFINTTTWDVNDDLTVKNILSYAHLTQTTRSSVFGTNINSGGVHYWFFPAGSWHGIPTNSQNTFIEELQFQGSGFDDKLTWQAGLYYENSRPDGISGSLSPALAACTIPGSDLQDWNCSDALPSGGVVSNLGTIEYKNMAAYTQGTYNISDEYRVTLGLRYTVDKSTGESKQQSFTFADDAIVGESGGEVNFVDPDLLADGQVSGFNCAAAGGDPNDYCAYEMRQRSEAPTWSLGFDYLPTPEVMIYTKYSRGYRQGSVSIFAPDGLQEFDPEEVDAYEIGAKTTFGGAIGGTFNISAFYNDLKNQQLQANYVPCGLTAPCPSGHSAGGLSPTTAILNAGSSTIQGVEWETTLKLTQDLIFTTSYTYLSTKLDSLEDYPNSSGYVGSANSTAGERLTFSPRHSVTSALSYTLPVPATWGQMSLGGSYSFISDQDSCSAEVSPYCRLPSRRFVSLSANWKAIAGGSFDASLFVNNARDEEITTYVPGLYAQVGAEYRMVGEPRMWGGKVKYNF